MPRVTRSIRHIVGLYRPRMVGLLGWCVPIDDQIVADASRRQFADRLGHLALHFLHQRDRHAAGECQVVIAADEGQYCRRPITCDRILDAVEIRSALLPVMGGRRLGLAARIQRRKPRPLLACDRASPRMLLPIDYPMGMFGPVRRIALADVVQEVDAPALRITATA